VASCVINLEREIRMSTRNLCVGKWSCCSVDVGDKPTLDVVADAMRKSHTTKTTCIVPLCP
jgi:hypothetical protein